MKKVILQFDTLHQILFESVTNVIQYNRIKLFSEIIQRCFQALYKESIVEKIHVINKAVTSMTGNQEILAAFLKIHRVCDEGMIGDFADGFDRNLFSEGCFHGILKIKLKYYRIPCISSHLEFSKLIFIKEF